MEGHSGDAGLCILRQSHRVLTAFAEHGSCFVPFADFEKYASPKWRAVKAVELKFEAFACHAYHKYT